MALSLVRTRHLQYYDNGSWHFEAESDLARIRRDHEFLRVLASSVAKRGLGNFITDLRLIDSFSGGLVVDNGFSATAMAELVLKFHGIDPYGVPQYTLPVVVDGQPYFYGGGGYGDIVFPVQPQDREVVAQFLGTTPTQDSSGGPLPAASSFTVAVENGSGSFGQGTTMAAALTQLGFHVTSVTDTAAQASTTEATILYANPRQLPDALRVQSAMSGLAVLGYDPGLVSRPGGGAGTTIDVGSPLRTSQGADVVVVTGSNIAVNAPAVSSPSTTVPPTSTSSVAPGGSGGSPPTTTVPGPLTNSANLSVPSGATSFLEPWDPRSCSATGGEGP
jgi:hypothetical protein